MNNCLIIREPLNEISVLRIKFGKQMSPKIKIYKIYMHVRADKHLHNARRALFCFDICSF